VSGTRVVSLEVRRGALTLRAVACRAGADLTVALTGGDAPHVGCVVVARPHPAGNDADRTTVTSSVLALPPHRDEALARPLAERLAVRLGGTVAVVAGVHTEGLTEEGIAAYLALGSRLADGLARRLGR
jgi:hypothetical protein